MKPFIVDLFNRWKAKRAYEHLTWGESMVILRREREAFEAGFKAGQRSKLKKAKK